MKISRTEILRIKVRGYFERCEEFTENLPSMLSEIKDAPYMMECCRVRRYKAMASNDFEGYDRAKEQEDEIKARAVGALWALIAAGKEYGVKVTVKPWDIYGRRELLDLSPSCDELVRRWGRDWDGKDWSEEEEDTMGVFRGVYEDELERLKYEQEQVALFIDNAAEMRLRELENLDFAVLEYIVRGEIYSGVYRDSNWRDIARELAALSYYQRLARETQKKADAECTDADADCEKSANSDAGISVRRAIMKMAELGYFDARKDMAATHIAKELAEILGGSEHYARKVYREAVGLDRGGKER